MRITILFLWLILGSVLCNISETFAAHKLNPESYVVEGSFSKDGVYSAVKWDLEEYPKQPVCWGSFGGYGGSDQNTGSLESPEFQLRAVLTTFLSGYPTNSNHKLQLIDKESGAVLNLRVGGDPGERWQYIQWKIPNSWKTRRVVLRASDESNNSWLGICEVLPPSYKIYKTFPDFRPAFFLMREVLWHFFWLSVPASALLGLLLLRIPGLTDRILLPLFLVCAASIAYLTFWIYFINPAVGMWASVVITALLLTLYFYSPIRKIVFSREWYKELWGPLFVILGVTLFFLAIDYLYGGLKHPLLTSSNRFLRALPVDNILPLHFAHVLSEGRPVRPFFDVWNTSDRPPLQTAFVLWQYALMHADINYQILGTLVQTLLIAAAWALGRTFNISRGAQILMLGFMVFSSTTLIHSIFIWPKLLSAAYLLCAVVFLLMRKQCSPSATHWLGWFTGASVALGMLSHGASLFGVCAVTCVFLFWNRPRWGFLWRAGVCLIAFYLPWVCYQRFYDPPGDRLIKWHIAGTRAEDGVPAIDSIKDSYSKLSFAEIVDYKLQNLKLVFSGSANLVPRLVSNEQMLSYEHREDSFFYLFYSLDLLLLGFLAYLVLVVRRFQSEILRPLHFCFCLSLVGIVCWSLLMFGPGTTILHQGTFLISTVIGFALALALYYVSPLLAFGLLSWEVLRWLLAWVFAPLLMSNGENFIYNSPQVDVGMLTMMVTLLIAGMLYVPRLTVQRS